MSGSAAIWLADERTMLDAFLDDYRLELRSTLDGLPEEQARRSLVPSMTTLLGLVKHATFVELAWFGEGITFRSRADFGFASSVHCIAELAQHAGHADILREQILASDAALPVH